MTTLTAIDQESIGIKIPISVSANEELIIKIEAEYIGTQGFRTWLTDVGQGTMSNIIKTTDIGDFDYSNIQWEYTLTPTKDCTEAYLFFKGISYGKNIENLKIKSIQVIPKKLLS